LRLLNLSINTLQGEIPPSIGSLRRLQSLGLTQNLLTGGIPSNITSCTSLREMYINSNQGVQGSIPAEVGNMPSLSVLVLANNSLTGTIPSSLGNLSQLTILSLIYRSSSTIANKSHQALPQSLTNLTKLERLYAGVNGFTGAVPSGLGTLRNLQVFVLDSNMFEANNEEEWEFIASLTNCSRLQVLTIGWNRFAGKLPSSLANLTTNLQWLRAPNNNISGAIPSDIGNLASLEILDFRENYLLTGVIPESIGKLTQLIDLYLYSNNLSGRIPSTIGNLTSLSLLVAHANNLEGSIPPRIGNLSKLLALDLSSNKLTGLIPKEIMELSSISIILSLSFNLLVGPLPSEVGNLVNIEKLSLSGNKLSGEIPDTIGNCRVMEFLIIHDNSFQGSIPATLKNMAGLTILNLMNNKLNGSIPSNLGSLADLQELYLAHNNLSGSIPELLGNSTSLLRLDLSFNSLQGEVPKEGVFRNITGLSIVGNNELCGGMPQLHLPKCPSSSARKNKKGMPKSLRIAIPIAGAHLLLLSGLFWARFLQRKFRAAVKKEIAPRFMELELPIVPYNDILKGTDGFSEANFLGKGRYGTVYRGTLKNQAAVVAVKVFNVQQSGSYKSFQTECKALGRVRHRCLVKIITCCSSIDHEGQVFRALIFEFMTNGSLDRWIHSNFDGQNGHGALSLSQSFGITLIEMFTGKNPTDDMFRDGISLHYYAEAALPDKVMEIADSNFLLHDEVNNNKDTGNITRTRECLSAVIQLGVLCSKQLPTERLSMSDAAVEMHAIRDKYISTQQLSDVILY
ncbi:putative LRR receptor-like serine/threonine-protein kinase, partial [Dichanthelium oligosanthes]